MEKRVINKDEIKGMVLPVVDNVLDMAARLSGFDRALVKCEDFKDRLSRIRSETRQFSMRPTTTANGTIMSASLEVPRRNQNNTSYPCPNSTLQKNGCLSIQRGRL